MGLLLIADDVIMGPYGTGPIRSPTPSKLGKISRTANSCHRNGTVCVYPCVALALLRMDISLGPR